MGSSYSSTHADGTPDLTGGLSKTGQGARGPIEERRGVSQLTILIDTYKAECERMQGETG
jgi:hypothetical protein